MAQSGDAHPSILVATAVGHDYRLLADLFRNLAGGAWADLGDCRFDWPVVAADCLAVTWLCVLSGVAVFGRPATTETHRRNAENGFPDLASDHGRKNVGGRRQLPGLADER